MTRQKLDQAVQNSVKNTISPAAAVKLHSVKALGHEVVVVAVPPWNRKDVYHYEERVLIERAQTSLLRNPRKARNFIAGNTSSDTSYAPPLPIRL
jgi:predicted HTH transcriptional regulator